VFTTARFKKLAIVLIFPVSQLVAEGAADRPLHSESYCVVPGDGTGKSLIRREAWMDGGGSGPEGTYRSGDVVYYQGATYISLTDGNASSPEDGAWHALSGGFTPHHFG